MDPMGIIGYIYFFPKWFKSLEQPPTNPIPRSYSPMVTAGSQSWLHPTVGIVETMEMGVPPLVSHGKFHDNGWFMGTPISGNHQMLSVVTTSILSNSHKNGAFFARKKWTFPMERTDDNWWNHAETHRGVDTQPALFFFQRRAALRGSSLGYPVLWPFMSFWKVPKNTCYEMLWIHLVNILGFNGISMDI